MSQTPNPTPPPTPGPTPSSYPNSGFGQRREIPPRLHPKKVRGGIKVSMGAAEAAPWMTSWAAQRWVRLVETLATGPDLVEGLSYAKMGQTRSLTIEAGQILASVQGRADRAYAVKLVFPTFGDEQWLKVVQAMSEVAVYAAKLLAGELPTSIEDQFVPLGIKLFPTDAADVEVSCTCKRVQPGSVVGMASLSEQLSASTPEQAAPESPATPPAGPQLHHPPRQTEPPPVSTRGWCKHVACTAYLFAERLASDPFLMFRVRGLPGPELLDRLRHMRAQGQRGGGLYVGRVQGVSDVEAIPLEVSIDRYWEIGPEIAELETRIAAPPVAHPLLRRLGPSPFVGSTFPLVGLLASCYDTISADVLARAETPAPPAVPVESADDTEAEDDDTSIDDDESPRPPSASAMDDAFTLPSQDDLED
ncbi:MAG: hypothetical protein AABZ53_01410 [Planctomycetota bacterium]